MQRPKMCLKNLWSTLIYIIYITLYIYIYIYLHQLNLKKKQSIHLKLNYS